LKSRWKDLTQGSQFSQVDTITLQTNISNIMKFTILASFLAALATTGVSAAADAIPVAAAAEETARVLRATEPAANDDKTPD
jgi:hypothetical protein